jgi:hypothetical protein
VTFINSVWRKGKTSRYNAADMQDLVEFFDPSSQHPLLSRLRLPVYMFSAGARKALARHAHRVLKETRAMTRSRSFGTFLGSMDSFVTNSTVRQNRLVLIGFCAVLAFAWFCYQPAISGAFQFDDEFNLGGLAEIDSGQFRSSGGAVGARGLGVSTRQYSHSPRQCGTARTLPVPIVATKSSRPV